MEALLLALLFASAPTGTVEGVVTLRKGGQSAELKNALVFISGYETAAPDKPALMTQKSRAFLPAVLPVVRRQWVHFSNAEPDGIYHHVFSPSDKVKWFDTGKFKPPQIRKVQFPKEGRVDVFCDIHKEMIATIYVLPNPQFTVVDSPEGRARFQIPNVRAGRWRIHAWHRSLDQPTEKELVVEPNKTTQVELSLVGSSELEALLERHRNRNQKEYTEEERKRKEKGGW